MISRTRPHSLESVSGYPETLKIYRIDASPYWQVRLYVNGKYLRKSTKCLKRADAIEFAKQFYDSVRIAQRLDVNINPDTSMLVRRG